ncbi:unnamed protein product [Ixodes pacificus]
MLKKLSITESFLIRIRIAGISGILGLPGRDTEPSNAQPVRARAHEVETFSSAEANTSPLSQTSRATGVLLRRGYGVLASSLRCLTLTTASVIGRRKGVLPGRPAQRVPVLERRASRRRQGVRRRSPAVHGVLDAPHDQVEQGVDGAAHVVSRGRARLEVREAVLLGLGPGAGLTHGAALLQVRLVAAQHHVRVLAVRVRAELLQPRPDAARKDCSLVRSKRTRKPMASRKKAVVRLRNFSCPAVSHSCR